jgi:tRNA(Leu) C34 or U34 (ribose-2'-O)-methylase TrmL
MTIKKQQSNSHVAIALTNPKSPTNVGAVMRAAGCYQVDQVFYTGRRYEQAAKYNKDTLKTDTKNAQGKIPLIAVTDFKNTEGLLESIPADTKIICVDLVEGATPLPHFIHPEKAVYIFGPEDGTIKQEVIDKADDVVFVPTIGCMNLAASVNVLLYDRLSKALPHYIDLPSDDELIRSSRDTNNKVKVKTR